MKARSILTHRSIALPALAVLLLNACGGGDGVVHADAGGGDAPSSPIPSLAVHVLPFDRDVVLDSLRALATTLGGDRLPRHCCDPCRTRGGGGRRGAHRANGRTRRRAHQWTRPRWIPRARAL